MLENLRPYIRDAVFWVRCYPWHSGHEIDLTQFISGSDDFFRFPYLVDDTQHLESHLSNAIIETGQVSCVRPDFLSWIARVLHSRCIVGFRQFDKTAVIFIQCFEEYELPFPMLYSECTDLSACSSTGFCML